MASIKSKSETTVILTLKLLDGTWKREELKKISRPTSLDQDCFTLLDSFHCHGEPTRPLLELWPLKSKAPTKLIPSPSKTHSMITSTTDSKDTLKKEVTTFTPLRAWKTTPQNNKHGVDTSSKNSTEEERQHWCSPATQTTPEDIDCHVTWIYKNCFSKIANN